jgi:hypothetical protein
MTLYYGKNHETLLFVLAEEGHSNRFVARKGPQISNPYGAGRCAKAGAQVLSPVLSRIALRRVHLDVRQQWTGQGKRKTVRLDEELLYRFARQNIEQR